MSYKYCLYEYIEGIQYRRDEYKNESKNNDFDLGKVKAFNNAVVKIKTLLSENNLLSMTKMKPEDDEHLKQHKSIMVFNIDTDIDTNEEKLAEITKKFIVQVQELYNNLVGKEDLLSEGEMFGYHDVLDMLENDLNSFEYRGILKNFNISIPISLNKKVNISKL